MLARDGVRLAISTWSSRFLFFFQAEDGIRDLTVTGVQTCALPILRPKTVSWVRIPSSPPTSTLRITRRVTRSARLRNSPAVPRADSAPTSRHRRAQSEEGRVGKECRSRRWPVLLKKKHDHSTLTWC